MQLVANARELDTAGWMRGLISAGVSGAASSISGAVVLPSLDANDFNIFTPKYYIAILALGLSSAIVSVAKFLSTKPVPDYKEVTQMTQTITETDTGAVVDTTSETHTEPK